MDKIQDIIVIAYKEYNEKYDRYDTVVSHGVNQTTGDYIILPNVTVQELGAIYDHEIGEYFI